jgi:uncharacterized protein (TIGR00255 family)
MTGFARVSGSEGNASWSWDLRSVNGKSLDLRFRLPSGLEHLESAARHILSGTFKRGSIQASLNFEDHTVNQPLMINEAALDKVLAVAQRVRKLVGGGPPNVEALMNIRGVAEPGTRTISEEQAQSRDAMCLATLSNAAAELKSSRAAEGEKIAVLLSDAVARIANLTAEAASNPSRRPEAIRQKLKEQLDRLFEAASTLDPQRLHQEAMVLATRYDVQEELDRLNAHVAQARTLLASEDAIGRKFDFLAQEFNREANTLCSKSNDTALTHTGLELKNVIDQLREQIQNIE